MQYPAPPVRTRFIEATCPDGSLVTATPAQRFWAYLIDGALTLPALALVVAAIVVAATAGPRGEGTEVAGAFLLLAAAWGIGLLVWQFVAWTHGQTPGKQMLDLYVIRSDGTRAGGWFMFLRNAIVKGVVFGGLSALSGGIVGIVAPMWCLWDDDRQCLWDKMLSTYVAHASNGVRPLTAPERVRLGLPLPAPGMATSVPSNPPVTAPASTAERLRELDRLRSEGLITTAEYDERRARLLDAL